MVRKSRTVTKVRSATDTFVRVCKLEFACFAGFWVSFLIRIKMAIFGAFSEKRDKT